MSDTKREKMPAEEQPVSLKLEGINKAFGSNVIFQNFGYAFQPGIYAFSGPSGCGKSTLMRIIAGLDVDYDGEVVLNNEVQHGCSQAIHMMQQHYTLFPWKNVLNNVLMVYKGHNRVVTLADVEEAKCILESLGMGEHMHKFPHQLSGGQAQRVAFACAMMNNWSKVLLFDEPTSALDEGNDLLVADMIREHQKKHGNIICVITHEDHVIKRLGATVLELLPDFRLRPLAVEDVHEAPSGEGAVAESSNEEGVVEAKTPGGSDENHESIEECATS